MAADTWSGGREKLGRVGTFSIEHHGRPVDEGGDGVVWSCSCPKGRLFASYQWEKLQGHKVPRVKPCRHLRNIFQDAKVGFVYGRFLLTAAGERAAARCGCAHHPDGLQLRPKKPPPPPKPPGHLSQNGPCWCGSGEKLKRCEPEGSPHHDKHIANIAPPKPERIECGAMGPAGAGPCIHREGHVDRGYRIHRDDEGRRWTEPRLVPITWREKAKRAKVKLYARIEEILERARAWDEARREKARVRREARKAAKK